MLKKLGKRFSERKGSSETGARRIHREVSLTELVDKILLQFVFRITQKADRFR